MFSRKQSSSRSAHSDSKKKKKDRLKIYIANLTEFVVLIYIGASLFNFFIFPVPTYADGGGGMVSQEDFEDAHESNVLHHGWIFSPNPIMLVDPDCPYVQELADKFRCDYDVWTLHRIMWWIAHNIGYESDEVLYGTKEYWAMPCETLYYMKGDCEDYAILFCSIAKASGLDVCLLDYAEHMSAGVYLNGKLYFCNLYDAEISEDLKWEGNSPKILSLDPPVWYHSSTVFAWSNKWMHKGVDFILP